MGNAVVASVKEACSPSVLFKLYFMNPFCQKSSLSLFIKEQAQMVLNFSDIHWSIICISTYELVNNRQSYLLHTSFVFCRLFLRSKLFSSFTSWYQRVYICRWVSS